MSNSIYIFYVYAYIRSKDSINGKAGTPYYIGKGKGKRMYDKRHSINLPKNESFIVILESNLSEIGALALERRYIKWFGRIDNNTGILRNRTDGGEGSSGIIVSEDTKYKISAIHKGRKRSEETRKKMSESHKNMTEETRKKMSDAKKKMSVETKLKIGEYNKNKYVSEETRKKISDSLKGKTHSEETRKKISDSLKSKSRSEETKKKMRDAQRARRNRERF